MLEKLPAAVDFFTSIYGPYPFNAVGAIVDSAKVVGYSLETQTKPVFDRMPDEATLVHELSHMWFGDSVTLTTWPDIWLHEGFATWSEWIWSEHQGNKSAAQWFKQLYNTPPQDTAFWTPPPGAPGHARLPVQRHDLRPRRDDARGAAGEDRRHDASSALLRDWATQNRYGNVTTAQFIALAERSQRHGPRPLLRRLALPTGQAHVLVGPGGAPRSCRPDQVPFPRWLLPAALARSDRSPPRSSTPTRAATSTTGCGGGCCGRCRPASTSSARRGRRASQPA